MNPPVVSVPEDVASRYIAAFAGRTDVYGVYTADGWRPRRLTLAPSVVTRAFASRQPISLYLLLSDGMTHVAAIDFDTDDGFDQATRLGRGMWDDGVPAYIESSRRGAHLWVVLEERVHTRVLRIALRAFLQAVGLPCDDKKIELRPGDAFSNPDGIGLSLRGPMMAHPTTGVASGLLDPRTRELLGGSVAEVMEAIQQAPAERMATAAERYRPPDPPPASRPPMTGPVGHISDFNNRIGVSQLLQATGATWARPRGRGRCPFHDDQKPSMSVSHDDRRAWCWSPNCDVHRDGKGMDAWDLARLQSRRMA